MSSPRIFTSSPIRERETPRGSNFLVAKIEPDVHCTPSPFRTSTPIKYRQSSDDDDVVVVTPTHRGHHSKPGRRLAMTRDPSVIYVGSSSGQRDVSSSLNEHIQRMCKYEMGKAMTQIKTMVASASARKNYEQAVASENSTPVGRRGRDRSGSRSRTNKSAARSARASPTISTDGMPLRRSARQAVRKGSISVDANNNSSDRSKESAIDNQTSAHSVTSSNASHSIIVNTSGRIRSLYFSRSHLWVDRVLPVVAMLVLTALFFFAIDQPAIRGVIGTAFGRVHQVAAQIRQSFSGIVTSPRK